MHVNEFHVAKQQFYLRKVCRYVNLNDSLIGNPFVLISTGFLILASTEYQRIKNNENFIQNQ